MDFTAASGLNGYFDKRGAGEKVLLVHGFCEDHHIWLETADRLAAHYEVMLPDLPGFGASDIPPEGFSMQDYATWLKELVEQEWGSPFCFVGHSMGGYIGLAYAELFPQKLNSFALVNSHVYADSEEKKALRHRFIAFLQRHGVEPILRDLYRDLFTKEYLQAHPESLEALMERGRQFKAEGIIRAAEAMMQRPDRSAVWANLSVPSLMLAGRLDPLIPESRSIEQAVQGNEVMVEIIDNLGHMGPTEQAEAVAEILHSFLVQSLNLLEL